MKRIDWVWVIDNLALLLLPISVIVLIAVVVLNA